MCSFIYATFHSIKSLSFPVFALLLPLLGISPFLLHLVNSYAYSKSQLTYHLLYETFPSSPRQDELHPSYCGYHVELLIVSIRL